MPDPLDGPTGGWTRDELDRAATVAVGDPLYYAVAGSRLYGFADSASDLDLRGVHRADGRRYALLDRPEREVRVDAGRAGGPFAPVEFVSRELRAFGELVAASNFNALETLCAGLVVRDDPAVDRLRETVREFLPLDVPARYLGMARGLYEREVRETASVAPKTLLYVLRAVLGALYVAREEAIRANVFDLAAATDADGALVSELVAAKRRGDRLAADADLTRRTRAEIERLFGRAEAAATEPPRERKRAFRAAVDDWMWETRGWGG